MRHIYYTCDNCDEKLTEEDDFSPPGLTLCNPNAGKPRFVISFNGVIGGGNGERFHLCRSCVWTGPERLFAKVMGDEGGKT